MKRNVHLTAIWVIAAAIVILAAPEVLPARVLRVPQEYQTLQEAVYYSEDGDTILVDDGTYSTFLENVQGPWEPTLFRIERELTFRSVNGPEHTFIVQGSGGSSWIICDKPAHWEGFTFQDFYSAGSILWLASLTGLSTVIDCVFQNNTAHYSVVVGGPVTVEQCTFKDNQVSYSGAILHIYGMLGTLLSTVQDCQFLRNRAPEGALSSWADDILVDRCIFIDNAAFYSFLADELQSGASGKGGAIRLRHGVQPVSAVVSNCLMAANRAVWGGAISIQGIQTKVLNCTIVDNYANYGGGVHSEHAAAPLVENSILWGNAATYAGDQVAVAYTNLGAEDAASAAIIRYSNVQGDQAGIAVNPQASGASLSWGSGNISMAPNFIDAGGRDYRLHPDSPCRDAGYSAAAHDLETDLLGAPRILGDAVDIGAYEYGGTETTGPRIPVEITGITLTGGARGMFVIRGEMALGALGGYNVHVRVGTFETTLEGDSQSFMHVGSMSLYRGTQGGVSLALLNYNAGTIMLVGQGIDFSALESPVEVDICFCE